MRLHCLIAEAKAAVPTVKLRFTALLPRRATATLHSIAGQQLGSRMPTCSEPRVRRSISRAITSPPTSERPQVSFTPFVSSANGWRQ